MGSFNAFVTEEKEFYRRMGLSQRALMFEWVRDHSSIIIFCFMFFLAVTFCSGCGRVMDTIQEVDATIVSGGVK